MRQDFNEKWRVWLDNFETKLLDHANNYPEVDKRFYVAETVVEAVKLAQDTKYLLE